MITIFTHTNCPDGYTCAWICWKKYGINKNVQYVGLHPNTAWAEYPDIKGHMVLMFDVCPTKEAYDMLQKHTKQFHVYDHHVSNYRMFKDSEHVTFDLDHSAAYMAWKVIFPKTRVPSIVKYIEDNDMGWWKLSVTKSLSLALSINHKLNFSKDKFIVWDNLLSSREINKYIGIGNHYLNLLNYLVQPVLKTVKIIKYFTWTVGVVETDFKKPLSSHLANHIANDLNVDFAAIVGGKERRHVMMRASSTSTVDLSIIASKYGGGGHAKAASMTLPDHYTKFFSIKKV